MPMPVEYQRATDHFLKFMREAQEYADLGSSHQTYTMVQGVFQTFRRRLTIKEAILFAGVLPAVLRAVFVADWDIDEPKREFEDLNIMTKEVQALRADHNFAPDTAIKNVAQALRQNVDIMKFNEVIAKLPEGAKEFWQP